MSQFIAKRSKKIGAAPGTLIHIGKKLSDNTKIIFTEYDKDFITTKNLDKIEDFFPYKNLPGVKWLTIEGLHETENIAKLGHEFNLHPLMLEDILNTGQRSKIDDYGDYIFVVMKIMNYNELDKKIVSEQISFVLLPNMIISFQEKSDELFDGIRERIKTSKGNIRKLGADYLLYALIDAIVDNYFVILEKLGDRIDEVEDALIDDPQKNVLQEIHELKRELLYFRNTIWPLREVVSILVRSELNLFNPNTVVYLRDVYDHIIQVIDTVEVCRDMLSGMLDTYLSSVSNKTNEVMKVLTIISTIFIPITFIAGVYGMNFPNMPELSYRWSYPLFWIVSSVITIFMLNFFKKKRWI